MNNDINPKIDEMKRKAEENMDIAKDMAGRKIRNMKYEMDKARVKLENYIHRNPEKATIISAGIGAVFGAIVTMIMRGRRRK